MSDLILRPARHGEGDRLRRIAVDAKAHWGYNRAEVEGWIMSDPDFSDAALAPDRAFVAEVGGRVVGWAAASPKGRTLWLSDLWVEPAAMGRGVGRALFERVVTHARSSGADALEWEAEIHSVGFYERLGARYLRDSEPGRFGPSGPVMTIDLGSSRR